MKILEENEKKNPYLITLWWGLDGLRLNEDGTIEMVTRAAKIRPEIKNNRKQHRYLTIPTDVFSKIVIECG